MLARAAHRGRPAHGRRRAGGVPAVGRARLEPGRRPAGRGRGRDLLTFSIGFESHGGIEGDEFRYSDVIAQRFATDHHRIRIAGDRLLPALGGAIAAMSEPMVSHDVVAFYLLSQEVARHVKVVQSGQGADEVFAGYHWYPPMLEPGAVPTGACSPTGTPSSTAPTSRWPRWWPRRAGGRRLGAFVAEPLRPPGAATPIDRALRLDSEVMLVDDPVKRVDNMTMAWGSRPGCRSSTTSWSSWRPPARPSSRWPRAARACSRAARTGDPRRGHRPAQGLLPGARAHPPRGPLLDMVRRLTGPAAKQRGLFEPGYVDPCWLTPTASSRPWGQQAVAARAARAVARGPRDRAVTDPAAPAAPTAATAPPLSGWRGGEGGCPTARSAGGTARRHLDHELAGAHAIRRRHAGGFRPDGLCAPRERRAPTPTPPTEGQELFTPHHLPPAPARAGVALAPETS